MTESAGNMHANQAGRFSAENAFAESGGTSFADLDLRAAGESVERRVDKPILECRDLTKRFSGMVAVSDVSLRVEQGGILGVIGPNGAGKTTLFNLVTGQLKPNNGTVTLAGRDVTAMSVHERVRLGMGRTFQVMRPLRELTLLENVMIGAFARHRARDVVEEKAWEVVERVGLASRASQRAGQLSLPDRKRLEVARALATEPRVLLLDEVMAGLNPSEIEEAIALVHDLHANGLAVVLIEHNLKVVRSLSHRVVVLDRGAVIAEGTPQSVLNDEKVVAAYIGNRK